MTGTFFSACMCMVIDWAKINWDLWITAMNKTINYNISGTFPISFLLILMHIPKRDVRVM